MKTNPENIPAIVYDWMKQFAFGQLHPAQQEEVKQYFTAEEYDNLHTVHRELSELSVPAAQGKNQRKALLLERFDQVQKPKKDFVSLLNRQVVFWKAAAVFVMLLAGWIFFYLNESKAASDVLVAQTDTVYVTKEIPAEPVKVYDTVYVDKYQPGKTRKETVVKTVQATTGGTISGMETGDNVVFSVKELENKANLPKGNSMKDDTLLRRYSFVTM